MEICVHDKCTGCYACVNVCMAKCISMEEDNYGELHPIVDETKCKKCNQCINVCPNNKQITYSYPKKCLASWITDKKKRLICASGGLGTIMSEYVIKHKKGVVYGTKYDDDLTPVTTFTEDLNSLELFKGSKYVQSIVGKETFISVKNHLRQGRFVIYIGTPCQIAGLQTFLHKDYDNLITVDLICHGVCPTRYLRDEVKHLNQRFGFNDVADIRFRGNDGNNYRLSLWDKDRRKLFPSNNYREKLLRVHDSQQFYMAGFLLGVSMRENCYSCQYARPERISDITIGDFIGLGKNTPFDYSRANVSSVTLNTDKGIKFYEDMSSTMTELVNVEREYTERLEYGPSLRYPSPRHKLNAVFRDYYLKFGYVLAIRKTLKSYVRKRQLKAVLHYWTFAYRVPRKIYRIIKSKTAI